MTRISDRGNRAGKATTCSMAAISSGVGM